jgi:hypothetical protein
MHRDVMARMVELEHEQRIMEAAHWKRAREAERGTRSARPPRRFGRKRPAE